MRPSNPRRRHHREARGSRPRRGGVKDAEGRIHGCRAATPAGRHRPGGRRHRFSAVHRAPNTNPPTCSNPGVLTVLETGNGSTQGGTCPSAPSLRCSTPKIQDVTYTRTDPACDPTLVACAMTATIDVEFPRNSWNYCDGNSVLGSGLFFVNGAQQAQCGNAPWTVNTDFATFTVTRSIACSDTNTYTFEAAMCGHGFCGFSAFRSLDFIRNRPSGCIPPDPPKASCGGGSSSMGANMCCFGPGGGSSPAGAPPGFAIPGMNARLVYQAVGLERSRAFPGHDCAPRFPRRRLDSSVRRPHRRGSGSVPRMAPERFHRRFQGRAH